MLKKYMMLLILTLSSMTGCGTGSVGKFCTTYLPVYTNQFERSYLQEETERTINKNNAVYACKCLKEREFCK